MLAGRPQDTVEQAVLAAADTLAFSQPDDPTEYSQLAFIRPVGHHSTTSNAFWQYIHQY
ncbi:hypothetical protein [Lacticaseibacillus baoqingensis]|uniref:hypothetical protein n=1 Tax=Lacticaseibacillus baoqingensis TaxID=2486013 RepID=UPI0013DDF820|nr:hypothetical protein [Lacticaseibacillus baoqingensis]